MTKILFLFDNPGSLSFCTLQFVHASCYSSLSVIPFFDKLQRDVDELKVVVAEKDKIVSTTRSDLVKLNSQKNLLELKVDSLQEKLKQETAKLRDVQVEKEVGTSFHRCFQ